ncbi:hypothetical protein HDV05_003739 [Chytridiales sp. JEL 0842]|nr:hypothetical protein HDV05_003739 [Chytridiales sp. JEL 0842]
MDSSVQSFPSHHFLKHHNVSSSYAPPRPPPLGLDSLDPLRNLLMIVDTPQTAILDFIASSTLLLHLYICRRGHPSLTSISTLLLLAFSTSLTTLLHIAIRLLPCLPKTQLAEMNFGLSISHMEKCNPPSPEDWMWGVLRVGVLMASVGVMGFYRMDGLAIMAGRRTGFESVADEEVDVEEGGYLGEMVERGDVVMVGGVRDSAEVQGRGVPSFFDGLPPPPEFDAPHYRRLDHDTALPPLSRASSTPSRSYTGSLVHPIPSTPAPISELPTVITPSTPPPNYSTSPSTPSRSTPSYLSEVYQEHLRQPQPFHSRSEEEVVYDAYPVSIPTQTSPIGAPTLPITAVLERPAAVIDDFTIQAPLNVTPSTPPPQVFQAQAYPYDETDYSDDVNEYEDDFYSNAYDASTFEEQLLTFVSMLWIILLVFSGIVLFQRQVGHIWTLAALALLSKTSAFVPQLILCGIGSKYFPLPPPRRHTRFFFGSSSQGVRMVFTSRRLPPITLPLSLTFFLIRSVADFILQLAWHQARLTELPVGVVFVSCTTTVLLALSLGCVLGIYVGVWGEEGGDRHRDEDAVVVGEDEEEGVDEIVLVEGVRWRGSGNEGWRRQRRRSRRRSRVHWEPLPVYTPKDEMFENDEENLEGGSTSSTSPHIFRQGRSPVPLRESGENILWEFEDTSSSAASSL